MLNEGPKMPTPTEFATTLAQSDGYEVAAAQTALAQSHNAQVRSFAQTMITDHERMDVELRAVAQASRLEPPQLLVGAHQARLLSGLQSLRGDAFDREYARQQVLSHTSALTVVRSYAEKGSDANLRRMAASSAPVIEQHLQAARQLLQSMKPSA